MTSLPVDRTPRIDAEPRRPADDVVLQAVDLQKHFKLRGVGTRDVVHAVDDVNLELRRGRVLALVGESGSGKSTMARLLAQLYARDRRATSCCTARPSTVRGGRAFRRYVRRVQMIFQDPFASLNPVHTVRYPLTRRCASTARPAARRGARGGARRAARPGAAHAARALPGQVPARARPAASASGSRSPAPWAPTPRRCSPTSRCRCSTCRSGSACSTCCRTCATG